MKSKGTQRQGICAYCYEQQPLTRDHIPPRNLFSKPRPTNLITVPCCEACNKRWSMDDEYFRMALLACGPLRDHAAISSIRPAVISALDRPQSAGFKQLIWQNISASILIDDNGRYYLGDAKFEVDLARLNNVARRIVQGLFFRERRVPLPAGYVADADLVVVMEDVDGSLARAISELYAQPSVTVGDGVFTYRAIFDDADPNVSAWLLMFYDRLYFLGSTDRVELND